MADRSWMLYGANGKTGRLVLEEALSRGHRPILAGRNARTIRELAELHALPRRTFGLNGSDRELDSRLEGVDLLVNIAGPYTATALPLVRAAIRRGCSYVDVCGELQVFEAIAALDGEAAAAGSTLLPGCGFEIVPSDAIALWLHERMPDAVELELGISSRSSLSAGTFRAATGVIAQGGFIRRDGTLHSEPIGVPGPNVRFHQGERGTVRAPFPDLLTAWRLTGIPNITTYLAMPPGTGFARRLGPLLQKGLRIRPLRRLVNASTSISPGARRKNSETNRGSGSFWGRVRNEAGETMEAWLRTGEPYSLTARTVVRVVEKLDESSPPGFQTPAGLFGSSFAEKVCGNSITERLAI